MRVLVTGGAGFIGANLCRALADLTSAKVEVRVLDDLSTGFASNLHGVRAELVVGSVLDAQVLASACVGVDAIVHLAARASVPRSLVDPIATHRVNVDGTLAVLEAARSAGVRHLVLASSSSVYGMGEVTPKHEQLPVAPLSPYAASKLAAESYALAYQTSFGLPVLALRFFNVYGPLQAAGHAYAAVIPAFVAAATADEPLPVYGDGEQTRDFTHVDTVCAVLVDAVLRGVAHPGPVNLAFGTSTSLLALIALLEEQIGHAVSRQHLPARTGDIRASKADGSLLAQIFPDVRPVPLPAGLASTVAWFRSDLAAA